MSSGSDLGDTSLNMTLYETILTPCSSLSASLCTAVFSALTLPPQRSALIRQSSTLISQLSTLYLLPSPSRPPPSPFSPLTSFLVPSQLEECVGVALQIREVDPAVLEPHRPPLPQLLGDLTIR